MKRALVTGMTGQDGSYLTELLLAKGYEVHGLIRHSSSVNTSRIEHLLSDYKLITTRLFLHYGDLSESSNLQRILKSVRPDEIYHLAAQSHVRLSFDMPEYTADVTGVGTVRLLDAVMKAGISPRIYQASSSEMFGRAVESPQTERTPFYPRSPYGCAKVFSYWTCVNYREAYDLHVSNGICFNHESPRRGENFVTRKISRAAARIAAGKQTHLVLGNLDAMRDWGYAKDYVEAMWLMLQQKEPDDYVIATGETHSVRDFLEEAFSCVGLDWRKHVKLDPALQRPTEVDRLVGDSTKARTKLGWKPTVGFRELVRLMVEADLEIEGISGRGKAA